VTADGRLNLEGTLKALDWLCDPDLDLHLSGWETNLNGAGSMIGRWAQNLTINRREGSAHEEVDLVTMSRTATAVKHTQFRLVNIGVSRDRNHPR
jgi:hypothetical protein